jgi:hypothetical protein
MRGEITRLIVEIQKHASLIPSYQKAIDLLAIIGTVIEEEKRYKEYSKLTPTKGYDGLRRIRYSFADLVAQFGYTLKELKES